MLTIILKIVFAVVASVFVVAALYYLEEGRWPQRLEVAWWRLTRRCVRCGAKRELHAPCFHCAASRYYDWRTCHACSKTINFARGYGMNMKRIEEKLFRELGMREVPNYHVQAATAASIMSKITCPRCGQPIGQVEVEGVCEDCFVSGGGV